MRKPTIVAALLAAFLLAAWSPGTPLAPTAAGAAPPGSVDARVVLAPTTTYRSETANNTSASPSFNSQANGNHAPGNVSHLSTRSLLYPDAKTRIYTTVLPWFGDPADPEHRNHMDVGYRSDDPAQVARQIDDMMQRGIDGAIVDWFGRPAADGKFGFEDASTQIFAREAGRHAGDFEFAIMEDAESVLRCSCTDATAKVTDDLRYAYEMFESSPAYMRIGGHPVVFIFGLVDDDLGSPGRVDWDTVRAQIPGEPLFVVRGILQATAPSFRSGASETFQNKYVDAFSGAYTWVDFGLESAHWDERDTEFFYETAKDYASGDAKRPKYFVGAAFKGFNETLASWRQALPQPYRMLSQDGGQTWLSGFKEVSKYYNAQQPLPAIQLITWNDYDEGTEIETGIDNGLSVSAALSGSRLAWSISADEGTVDHYSVFVSDDGDHMMSLGNLPVGARSFDLSRLSLPPGRYRLAVKAVGKPSLLNHISQFVIYSPESRPAAGTDSLELLRVDSTVSAQFDCACERRRGLSQVAPAA